MGTLVAIIVEDAKDVAAFANYAAPAAAAAAPAPAPKAAAAAPAPAPAPAPAAPAPTKAAPPPAAKAVAAPPLPPLAAGDDYYAFARWGSSLQRSPLAAALAEQQNAYVALYGETGQLPLPMPETKKKAAA